jgi:hypothetical protein
MSMWFSSRRIETSVTILPASWASVTGCKIEMY